MPNLKAKTQSDFEQYWRGMLSDYVTAIAWSNEGEIFAASSASGEVVLYHGEKTKQAVSLQTEETTRVQLGSRALRQFFSPTSRPSRGKAQGVHLHHPVLRQISG